MKKKWIIPMIVLTAVGLVVTGIIFKQSPLRIAPLFISLAVYALSSRVNRYALLIGAFNSLLYAWVYTYYKLYASVFSAVAFSFVFQLVTFIKWNKRPYGQSTVLKKLSPKQTVISIGLFIAAWCVMMFVLKLLKANYSALDSTCSLIGIASSILMLCSYYEYTFINILSVSVSVVLYIVMIPENPEQVTYLVFSVYSLICCVVGAINAIKLYKKQREENV